MAFYTAVKYKIQEYADTSGWLRVLPEDSERRALIFFVIPGDPTSACKISFVDTDQDNNHVEIQDGVMWEPRITPTNEVWINCPSAATTDPVLSISVTGPEDFIVP